MKRYQKFLNCYWWPPDKSLIKKGYVMCPKCGKHEANLHRNFGVTICKFCQAKTTGFSSGSISKADQIRSRTVMPDGTVLTGQAGIRERDRRLRVQRKFEKYSLKNDRYS